MKTEEVFPSRFLKAEQLDHDVTATIEKVVMEDVYDSQAKEEVQKPVCYFEKATKAVLLNKTNWAVLVEAYGDESDLWAGKPVVITTVEVKAFGDVVRAIRLKLPKVNGTPSATPNGTPTTPANGTPAKSEVVTAFWAAVKHAGLTLEDGKRALSECGGDFEVALSRIPTIR